MTSPINLLILQYDYIFLFYHDWKRFVGMKKEKFKTSKKRSKRTLFIILAANLGIVVILVGGIKLNLINIHFVSNKIPPDKNSVIILDKSTEFHKDFDAHLAKVIPVNEPLREEIEKADTLFSQRQFKKSYKLYKNAYKKALSSDNKSLIGLSLIGMGISYGSQGAYNKAMKALKEARNYKDYMDPSMKVKLFINLASCNEKMGKDSTAIGYYNTVIELDTEYPKALNRRGNFYLDRKEYDLAIQDFSKAIEIDSGYFAAYLNRSGVYTLLGEYDLALQDINKGLELTSEFPEGYINRGSIYSLMGKYDLAIQDLERSIELNPSSVETYINKGTMYQIKGQYDKALVDYNKALELNPEYAGAYNNRGYTYYLKGEYDSAMKDFNKALELDAEIAQFYLNRGAAYLVKKEYDKAILDFDKSLELNPQNPDAYYNKWIIYYSKGEFNKAILNLDKVLEISPEHYKAYFDKAAIYEKLGRKKEALELYKTFLICVPPQDMQHVMQARTRINELQKFLEKSSSE